MKKDPIYKEWKKEQLKRLTLRFPRVPEKRLLEIIEKSYDESLKDGEVKIVNNYVKKTYKMSMLQLIDFIRAKKPILSGFGMMFKNQNEIHNPTNVVITKFINSRGSYKKELKKYEEGSYEYKAADRMQLNEKININSLYGAFGTLAFFLHNIFTAAATTATGQALITTMIMTYENFLGGAVKFNTLDDIYQFVSNIVKDAERLPFKSFLENKTVFEVQEKLMKYLSVKNNKIKGEIFSLLNNLPQNVLNLLYYKNNIYDFIMLPKPYKLLMEIFNGTESFKDPNRVPEEISKEMDELWLLLEQYVFYNYHIFDRIQRGKTDTREIVVVTDTDSTMLNLGLWYDFIDDNFISKNKKLQNKNPRELEYIVINVICTMLSKASEGILRHYCESCNILDEYAHLLNAKNEFLFSIMILALTKKRYISRVRLREGREFKKEKTDIKGHDFIKSSSTKETREYFTKIVEEELVDYDNINPLNILKKFMEFDNVIKESLSNGEKNFLVPKSVKEFSAYNPDQLYKEQGVRAIIAWDTIYPNMEIELPAKFDLVKVRLETLKELAPLEYTHPDIYRAIKKGIFENKNEKISSKGVQVIAIPKKIPTIPEWIIPYIDYDTMIADNINRAVSLLSIFGIEQINSSRNKYISNIISI